MSYQQPETHEQKAPFPLTEADRSPTKSKDDIRVVYEEEWSTFRAGRAERTVHCYTVDNLTKHNQYTVELFKDDRERPHGFCNCQAAVICKHIKAGLEDLLQREPDFLQGAANEQS